MRSMVVLLALLSTNCSPCQHLTTTQRDSISIELRERIVTLRDTIFIEIPQSSQRVIIRSDSSFLSNDFAHSEAIILPDGELYHTLESTPQPLTTEYTTTVEVRDSIIYRDRTVFQTIEVERKLSWWQELQIKGFRLLALLLLGVLVIRKLLN